MYLRDNYCKVIDSWIRRFNCCVTIGVILFFFSMGFGYRQLPVAGRKEDRPAIRWKGNAGYDANIVNNSDDSLMYLQ